MSLLQALMRCSLIVLFLGLLLQLVIGQKPLIVKMSPILKGNITEATNIQCNVSTQTNECVPIKVYVLVRKGSNCYPKPELYKACVCPQNPPRNFSWNICSQRKRRSLIGPVSVFCMAEIITAEPELCV